MQNIKSDKLDVTAQTLLCLDKRTELSLPKLQLLSSKVFAGTPTLSKGLILPPPDNPIIDTPSWAEVIDGIFIGNIAAAEHIQFLSDKNIGLIINCANSVYCTKYEKYNQSPPVPMYAVKDFNDVEMRAQDLARKIQPASTTIDMFRAGKIFGSKGGLAMDDECERDDTQPSTNKNVLIHCMAGINRSAVTIGDYLGYYHKMEYDTIYNLLRNANSKRGLPVLTNPAFRSYLIYKYSPANSFDQ
jgi:hypothetical protein